MLLRQQNKPKANKEKKFKEKKLNCVLIQNGKIVVIFFCLQAKFQLFQEIKVLFENFFGSCLKKACFFQVEQLPKKL